MSNFDVFFEQLVDRDMEFVQALLGPFEEVNQEIREYFRKEETKKGKCLKTSQPYTPDLKKLEELSVRHEQAAKLSAKLISKFEETPMPAGNEDKENSAVSSETLATTTTTTTNSRPKRAAFREASQMINKQISMKLNDKLRREDVIDEKSLNMNVKTEKLSVTPKDTVDKTKGSDDADDDDNAVMPPPKCLPIKTKPNRRIKKEQLEISIIPENREIVDINKIKQETNIRGSDIILKEPRISLVDLTLSINTKTNDDSTRGTYVIDKSIKKKQSSEKRNRDTLNENNENILNKKPKSNPNIDVDNKNDSVQTHYDDAVSNIEHVEQINVTFVATSPVNKNIDQHLTTTDVIQKEQQSVNIPDSLLTDDESDEEQKSKYNSKQLTTSKQVFSAFEQSPVKKKVEAFEKLGASVNLPVRITRTKTRALEQQKQQQQQQGPQQQNVAINNSIKLLPTNNVKEKAKFFSPIPLKIKQPPINKAQTTIKTKIEENRQKEIVAIEKRNARLQQLMDERRRKREEKELKAQQQREALEREKMKQLEEQEKLKDERHKRLLFEQEQKKQKLREEAERKRLLIKQKALKEKQKQQQQTIQKPKYLTMEIPRLPTNDCYDSDEEDYRKKKIIIPDWCEDENLERLQYKMAFAGEKIKNTFFSRQVQTVDLQDLFQTTNPKILKRTSSALWTKAPKYSILPSHFESNLEISVEVEEEEEED